MKYILVLLIMFPADFLSQSKTKEDNKSVEIKMKREDRKIVKSLRKMDCTSNDYQIFHIPSLSFNMALSKQLLASGAFIDSMEVNYRYDRFFWKRKKIEYVALIVDSDTTMIARNSTNYFCSYIYNLINCCNIPKEQYHTEYYLIGLKYRQKVDYIFYCFNLFSYIYLKDGRWYLVKSELSVLDDKSYSYNTFSIPFDEYVDDNWERLKKIKIGKE